MLKIKFNYYQYFTKSPDLYGLINFIFLALNFCFTIVMSLFINPLIIPDLVIFGYFV